MHSGELFAGRYEIVTRLGRGGMGEVWSARDRSLRRDVAVKLLYLDDTGSDDAVRRFEREAVAAAQISHPNVAVVHDRGVQDGVLFLVMERIDGATLSQALRGGTPLPLPEAVRIGARICDALLAAHRAGVIHYDIKPHNVMIATDGTVKVVDFGIAGFAHSQFTVARTSQLAPAGTPEFGAPEQFLEERGDERSDLYALGGVLFCMLTGQPPFQGQNGIAVMMRKRDEAAPRVDSLVPGVPPALTDLVAELLERDAARRPQTAAEVSARLAGVERRSLSRRSWIRGPRVRRACIRGSRRPCGRCRSSRGRRLGLRGRLRGRLQGRLPGRLRAGFGVGDGFGSGFGFRVAGRSGFGFGIGIGFGFAGRSAAPDVVRRRRPPAADRTAGPQGVGVGAGVRGGLPRGHHRGDAAGRHRRPSDRHGGQNRQALDRRGVAVHTVLVGLDQSTLHDLVARRRDTGRPVGCLPGVHGAAGHIGRRQSQARGLRHRCRLGHLADRRDPRARRGGSARVVAPSRRAREQDRTADRQRVVADLRHGRADRADRRGVDRGGRLRGARHGIAAPTRGHPA
ncbi:protein kinase [Catenulispora yoronensis]